MYIDRLLAAGVLCGIVVIGDPALRAGAQAGQNNAPLPPRAAQNVEFEVASVKRSRPDQPEMNGLYTYPGGRVVARGATVEFLIMRAYDVDRHQIVGGPAWIDAENTNMRFDIDAKPPSSFQSLFAAPRNPRNPPPDEIRQMLQNLLAERFQLKLHVQQSKGQVYELVRNKRPLRLSAPKDRDAFPWAGGTEGGLPDGAGLRGQNISMPELATRLTQWLECPVIDQTGLSESYDFSIGSEADDTGLGLHDSISQSLKDLGLELKKSVGTVYKLVVDQVSLPSSN